MLANAYQRSTTALYALMFFLLSGGLIFFIVSRPDKWAEAMNKYPLYVDGGLILIGLIALNLTGLVLKREWARRLATVTAVLALFLLLQEMARFVTKPFVAMREKFALAQVHLGALLIALILIWALALLYFSLGSALANRSTESSLTVEVLPKTK